MSHRVCPQPPAGSGDSAWEQTLSSIILQFLGLVHRSYPQDPAWRTPDFLQTLAIITFPLETQKEATSESSRNTSSPRASAEASGAAEGFQASFKPHPARRQLKEFMQVLLRELLLGVSSPKQWLPLEVLLEVG